MASVTEAEGLAELGLWQEAWEALDGLTDEDWTTPQPWRVRLLCCAPLGAWDAGRNIADLLKDGSREDRQLVARFYQVLALRWMSEGDPYAAGQAIKAAVKAWPDSRVEILDHPELSEAL